MISFGQRLAAVVATSLLLLSVVGASPVAAKPPSWSHKDAHVCAKPGPDQASCDAIARSFYVDGQESATPTKSSLKVTAAAAQSIYFDGTSIRTAYGMTGVGDPSLVVAIVDAYDDTNALANVARFRSDSHLPALQSCTLATLTTLTSSASSPCFTKTNQTGGTSLPRADAGWSNEIDLDLQAASAVCPMCSILLLEATSTSVGNLAAAVTTASNTAHVVAISNSYGVSGDYPGSLAPAYDNAAKKGIAVTASAGDGGYGAEFPASATNVIGVGGTTLAIDSNGVRTGETVWAGTGSGCSAYNAAPAWQSISGNPCAGEKAISDVSAVADPNSGLAIYTTVQQHHRVLGLRRHEPVVADHRGPLRAAGRLQRVHPRGPVRVGGRHAVLRRHVRHEHDRDLQPVGAVHRRGRLGRSDGARQHRLRAERTAGPDHDHRLSGERLGPGRRDEAVQRDGQGPVRSDDERADVHVVRERGRHHR